jgi:thiaminase
LIHNALSEIQKGSNKVIDLSDTLIEKLGLQQEQDIKKVPIAELNKTYLKGRL